MSKYSNFKKGDLVKAKKITGEEFLGIYEHGYDCGDHCVFNGTKKYCVNHNDVKKATKEEEEIIKETIIKPMRDEKKRKALENSDDNKALKEEDVETLASEPIEETETLEN